MYNRIFELLKRTIYQKFRSEIFKSLQLLWNFSPFSFFFFAAFEKYVVLHRFIISLNDRLNDQNDYKKFNFSKKFLQIFLQ